MNEQPESTALSEKQDGIPISRGLVMLLLVSTLVIAANGVVYELIIAGYSSYLLGDSIYQFSLTIGIFLSSMGVGSFISRFVTRNLAQTFIAVEVAISAFGGMTIFFLSAAYFLTANYALVMFGLTILLGMFIGIEIPLVTRLVQSHGPLRKVIANVLSFDYIGALAGSLAFPLVLLPVFGFAKTAVVIGLINSLVAVINLFFLRQHLKHPKTMWLITLAVIGVLVSGMVWIEPSINTMREKSTGEKQVYKQHTRYQQILLTKKKNAHWLYLSGHEQFRSDLEKLYHEMLVHPAMAIASTHKKILILGGGDGLALREIFKYPDVKKVVMVDIDPDMTKFAREHPLMKKLNKGVMEEPRLKIINTDALGFLRRSKELFDVIIIDLPDPTNLSLSKLYTVEFYRNVLRRFAPHGVGAVQSSDVEPLNRKPYWCIVNTMRASGLAVKPYHAHIGGFTLISRNKANLEKPLKFTVPTYYVQDELAFSFFYWPRDLQEVPTEVNRVSTHRLLQYMFKKN